MGAAVSVRADELVEISAARDGIRSWLAVAGGVDVPAVLGSRSTDTLTGLGSPTRSAGARLATGVAARPPTEVEETDAEPGGGIPNLSFHRSQIINDGELRVRLGRSHHLSQYQAKAEARGDALEAAILLGPPVGLVLAAAAPLGYDENEMEIAGKIAGAPLDLRRCRTIDLDVPVDTEIVIEGRILPAVRRPEGPFGEFMGYYVPVGDNHVFEVSTVTARRDAIFHSITCGSPEDLRLLEVAVATRTYQALLAANLEGIIDVACVPFTMSTIVKIAQQYEGHARQVLLTSFGANHDWNKTVFVVDEDVDINDFDDVWWAYLTRGRADTRAVVLPDVPGFYRDPQRDYWGRLGIDATAPFGRKQEFIRKRIPGAETIDLREYIAD